MSSVVRVLLYEIVAIAAAVAVWRFAFAGALSQAVAESRRLAAAARTASRTDPMAHWIAAAAIFAAAIGLRLLYVRQPMRYDEAWTYVHYASQGIRLSLTDYTYPNNHVLHTLCVWAITSVFGGSLIAVRLTALLAGLMIVPLAYLVSRRFAGRDAGLLAAAIVAGLPALVLYSTNARGYTIVCAAALVALLLASSSRMDSRVRWAGFGVALAVGMFTVPIMLFPAGVIVLWAAATAGRAIRRPLAEAIAFGALLTLIAYGPIIARLGLRPLVANPFVTPLSYSQFLAALPAWGDELRDFFLSGVGAVTLAIVGVGVVAACVLRGNPDDRPASSSRASFVLFVAFTVGWSAILAIAMRRPPFARVLLFLAPFVAIVGAVGLARLIAAAARGARWRELVGPIAALLLTAWIGVNTVRSGAVWRSDDTGTLRDGQAAAQLLDDAHVGRGDYIVVASPSGPPLEYYLYVANGRTLADFTRAAATRVFVIVNDHAGQTIDGLVARRRDIAWDQYGTPVLRHRFSEASVYEADAIGDSTGLRR